jgi:urease accessory protein
MTPPVTLREDPAWYTPAVLPDEVVALDDSLSEALDVGAAGKVGLLDLAMSRHGGVTRVRRHYQRAPLHLYRPIYLDSGRPDMAFLFLQQFGDGLVQGDRYRIDVDCGPGSATHITTQAATNVYRARQNFASQLVNLRVADGAVLEYLPDPVVPFRGSRLFQRTRVTVDPEATVILGETLLPGRVAHDEAHVYDLYWSETEVRSLDDALLFADVLRMNPSAGENPRSDGLLGPHDVIAALYVVSGRSDPAAIVRLLRGTLAATSDVLAGVSELPNGSGASVRLLGPSSKSVRAAFRVAWNAVRLELLGTPAPDLRKGVDQRP